MSKQRPKRLTGPGCLLFGILFLTVIISVFSVSILYNTYRLIRYESFPTVTGTIVSGDILSRETEDHNDRPATTYEAEISFTYEVDGAAYLGDTCSFTPIGSRDRDYIQDVLDRYPVGSRVDVIYNPARPSASVLEIDIGITEIISLLILVPLNLFMLWMWGVNASSIVRVFRRPPVGGISIVQRGSVSYVRLYRVSALTAGVAASLAVALLGALILVLSVGIDPPMEVVQAVWILSLSAGIAVYMRRICTVAGGAKDLLIDDQSRRLYLPLSFGRTEDLPIPMVAVKDVEVRTVSHRDSKGVTSFSYAPELVWSDGEGREQRDRIVQWRNDKRAEAFGDWLRRRIAGAD